MKAGHREMASDALKIVFTAAITLAVLIPYAGASSQDNSTSSSPLLRGSQLLYFQNPSGEDFNITVVKQDFNMYEGGDILNMTLVMPDGGILRDFIADDGITVKGNRGIPQTKTMEVKGLEGTYTLKLDPVSQGGDFEYRITVPFEKAVLAGREVFLLEAASAYFYVGNVKSFNVSWVNPWKEQVIKLYAGGTLVKEIKLNKTNSWQTESIEVSDKKNEMWHLEVTGAVRMRFSGIENYFSSSKEGWFDIAGIDYQQNRKSITFLILSIVTAIFAMLRRKYVSKIILAGFLASMTILILVMPVSIDVLVIGKQPDVNVPQMDFHALTPLEFNKKIPGHDVLVIPASKLDIVGSTDSHALKEGTFLIVPDYELKDQFFWERLFNSIRKNKILLPGFMPTLFLILALLVLSVAVRVQRRVR